MRSGNRIYFHSCENMKEVCDRSAQLVMISPPFTHNTDYTTLNKAEYLSFIERVLDEVVRILSDDGLLVSVNTDIRDHSRYNAGDRSFDGTVWFKHCDIRSVAERAGFKCVDCKIWLKSLNVNVYRYNFSHILFFSKKNRKAGRPGFRGRNRCFKADVWSLDGGTQRVSSDGLRFRNAIHPEIAARCIDALTTRDDLVVSPFTGSGTIPAVAELMGRRWIGYETDVRLKRLIRESIYGPMRPKIYATQEIAG